MLSFFTKQLLTNNYYDNNNNNLNLFFHLGHQAMANTMVFLIHDGHEPFAPV